MSNITYEQFENLCKSRGMTIDEGYRAMCFVSDIIIKNFSNHFDYVNKISNDNNYSDVFKKRAEISKNDANYLRFLYNNLDYAIYEMLGEQSEEVTI